MKMLLLHNYYQLAGGEDVVVTRERDLLVAHGHDVRLFAVSNDIVRSAWDRIKAAWRAPYSRSARRTVAAEINRDRPDIVHVHNFFPLLTPSVYDACRDARVPVVQTLHNYRLVCLNASLFRNGRVCEECLGKTVPWPGVLHGCYRGSRAASGAVAAMLTLHRMAGTWNDKVDLYIVPTEFVRRKLVQGGFPAHKIAVKPHFVHPDPGAGEGRGGYALFVGRFAPEKGLTTLLTAWARLGGQVPLKIVGEPRRGYPRPSIPYGTPGLEWLGRQSPERVQALMRDALVLLFPSLWYETFGLVIAEAYAAGLPVIAADLGNMSTLIDPGRTGLHYRLDDPADLAAKVIWLSTHPRERAEMGLAARRAFEQQYTADQNYRALMRIYALARERVPVSSLHAG